jgi:hypothetical protein
MDRPSLLCVVAVLSAASGEAFALDWQFGDIGVSLNNRVAVGAAWRMQDRNPGLIGKLNIEGQQTLCQADDCLSLNGDPGPNQRLVNASGALFGTNRDDGNLNYDRHDMVAATSRLTSDLKITWGDFLFRLRGRGYFDPVNAGFDDQHPNTLYQPAETPRGDDNEEYYAKGGELLDAYVQYAFQIGDRAGAVSVGNQLVRWGESGLVALNSVSEINPPNQVMLHTPGAEIGELFLPVPMALLAFDVTPGVSAEVLYQFGWVPVKPDARGSFFSDLDTFGDREGEPVIIGLGQFPEDPNGRHRFAGTLGLISSSSVTARLLPLETGEPEDGGQYGAKVSYFANWLNDTELGFYYLNYHSRLPYLSLYAAQESCARNSPNVVDAAIACGGFNGPLSTNTLEQLLGIELPDALGQEPITIDTIRVLVDYPEDIHMFGISFNTNFGGWSLAGEYSFRPNVPMQVGITDVVFAGLQPTFPRQDIVLPLIATLPSARHAVPDYIETIYRGHDVQGGQFIPGYERMKVGQLDITALQAFSNVLGSDQILFIGEIGLTHVVDMPSRDLLQFEGGGFSASHASPGADGTGSPGGQPDARRFNPTQQTGGFADDFAWGVRTLIRGEYNDVVFGWTFNPLLIAAWDIGGIAPYPLQNFVEGRIEITGGTEVKITPSLTANALYQWFTGAGVDNTRIDRDNVSVSVSYSF